MTPPPGRNGVIGIGGRNVRIQRLTISGGIRSAIVIARSGSARILDSVVSGAAGDGINATRAAYIEVRNSEVTGNLSNGIFVRNGSGSDIYLNDIHHNGDSARDAGIVISGFSSADISGNDIRDNTGDGVVLRRASSADFSSDSSVDFADRFNRINDNVDDGISCRSNSAYTVAIDQTILGNGGDGTGRSDGCSARLADATITCPPSTGPGSTTIADPTGPCPVAVP